MGIDFPLLSKINHQIKVAKTRVGIRSKIVTALIIAGVIPLIIAISITYFGGISQNKKMIGESFQQLSEKARENMMLKLSASIRAIRDMAILPFTIEFLGRASAISDVLSGEELSQQVARFNASGFRKWRRRFLSMNPKNPACSNTF